MKFYPPVNANVANQFDNYGSSTNTSDCQRRSRNT